jgi:tetratricopeptide (TPR) repeat protein
VIAIAALVCLAWTDAQVQAPSGQLERWLIAAADHQPGEADDWAKVVADWSKDRLVATLNAIRRDRVPAAALERGAILHLDVHFRTEPRERGPLLRAYPRDEEIPPPVTVEVIDGHRTGSGRTSTHLEFARLLLRELPPSRAAVFASTWYDAVAAQLAWNLNFAELTVHLANGRRLLPDDPQVFLASGCLRETFAAPRAQSLVRAWTGANPPNIGSEETNLAGAERFYRRALAKNPGLTEARFRLGRVMGQQGKHAEAVTELLRALGSAVDDTQSYYTLLFLGREEEMLGRSESARGRFEQAAALFPRAQSPRLALSRLALERGDDEGARRALVMPPGDPNLEVDPWWMYTRCEGRHADARLARLYIAAGEADR